MCGLSQDSGLGKVLSKTTVSGRFTPQVYGMDSQKDFEKKKDRKDLMATAPAFGTPEYAKWYDANQKTLLG